MLDTCGVIRKGRGPMPLEPSHSSETTGKYTCTRCGWRWTPRQNSPDPPRACARCRSAYWQRAPVSSRANSPDDPKWQAEREAVARRRQVRHRARLIELAAEFGFAPPPIGDGFTPAPVFALPNELSRCGVSPLGSRGGFSGPAAFHPVPASSIPTAPRMSLSERLAAIRAADAKIAPPK
jgi:hypothetical protein